MFTCQKILLEIGVYSFDSGNLNFIRKLLKNVLKFLKILFRTVNALFYIKKN